MKYFLNILIIISFCFSFESNFSLFSYKKINWIADAITLSGSLSTYDYTISDYYYWLDEEDYDQAWNIMENLNGSQNGGIYFCTGQFSPFGYIPEGGFYLEFIGSYNKFSFDADNYYNYDNQDGYTTLFLGNQNNINIHWGGSKDSKKARLGFTFGMEFQNNDWTISESNFDEITGPSTEIIHSKSEVSYGIHIIDESANWLTGIYFHSSTGFDSFDVYSLSSSNNYYNNLYSELDYSSIKIGMLISAQGIFTEKKKNDLIFDFSFESKDYSESVDGVYDPSTFLNFKVIMDI